MGEGWDVQRRPKASLESPSSQQLAVTAASNNDRRAKSIAPRALHPSSLAAQQPSSACLELQLLVVQRFGVRVALLGQRAQRAAGAAGAGREEGGCWETGVLAGRWGRQSQEAIPLYPLQPLSPCIQRQGLLIMLHELGEVEQRSDNVGGDGG